MNKTLSPRRHGVFWLRIMGVTLFAIAIIATIGFFAYEFQNYGRIANAFPNEKLDAMLNRTGEQIDAQSAADGYRQLNNPYSGAHALAIDAPNGSWLVSFKSDTNEKAKSYTVMYSNVNSVMYHNKMVKK